MTVPNCQIQKYVCENGKMSKTLVIKIRVSKRVWEPIKRAAVFGDKRKKRVRTRQAELSKAIREM
jgi:hypothetical protein